jgi:Protein of unknown function with PCYCGC motif
LLLPALVKPVLFEEYLQEILPETTLGIIIRSMKRILGCVVLGLVTMAASAQWTNPSDDVPAYNAKAPSKPLPPILSGNQLTGIYFSHQYQVTAYKMAAKIPEVLHQQPCYCHCDRAMGHNSLHSCFEGTHGAACSTCMKEAVYAYQQTKKGQTPSQIRAGIERGEWQYVDLEAATL